MESGLDVLLIGDTIELTLALDEHEEERDQAIIQVAKYHHRASRQRDKLIKPKTFKKGDLVLRRTFDERKLKPNWEGPFIILDDESKGPCRLHSPYEKNKSHL